MEPYWKEHDLTKWREGFLYPPSNYYMDGFICNRCNKRFDDFLQRLDP